MTRLRLINFSRLKRAYRNHRHRATIHNIPFLLTYEEWLTIWKESGHLHERGPRKGQYCMARYGDKGAYEIGNVRICTVEENHKEKWDNPGTRADIIEKLNQIGKGENHPLFGRNHSTEARENMRIAQQLRRRENPVTDEFREKIREIRTDQPRLPETKDKISQSLLGRKLSPETRENMRQGQLRRQERERNARATNTATQPLTEEGQD